MSITSPITATELATALRAVVRGDVVADDEPSFPAACFGVHSDTGHRPELVVIAETAADIAAAVRAATRAGRRIVVQHAGQQVAVTADRTILLVTRLLAAVRIDPAAGTARVGAGSTWRQVLAAADRYGLSAVPAPLAGTASGGQAAARRPGPVGRMVGFAASHIRSVQIVTPAGELQEIDTRRHSERFARLQRAGESGWVTAMTVDLVPTGQLYSGAVWFTADTAKAVKHHWQQWSSSLPAAASASIVEGMLPAIAELPPEWHSRPVVVVQFVHLGDPVVAARLLAPIRSAATPLLDGVRSRSVDATPIGFGR